ncbi:TetR/AcrR family transcriptional regulator [Nocardioides euryhalodurans]|uniref:TetR/AcrR family transcriptional regulator n=1 Tax=Nocardioides euryhalodurans TaxID=2518370 RepID=A0A4P7GJX9_9ACTN|nr:TetR/AcrR family transcriptional regulator [Nocardioides euryhalodurans]QBR92223.1 TetR/AcrR family transcriptional regulator [Nocardioides euryhalodurans]
MTTGTASARTRLDPARRRTQLLDLGVGLLATRTLDELTIDLLAERAGISRGLLYHYFGGKHAFHEAVVRRAVEDLVAQTAPPAGGEPLERLLASMTSYVDYVTANYEGYASIVRAAQGGHEALRRLHEQARNVLTDRIFTEDAQGAVIPDTPATRLAVRGWSAMTEELVLTWAADPGPVTRDQLLAAVTGSLPALVDLLR